MLTKRWTCTTSTPPQDENKRINRASVCFNAFPLRTPSRARGAGRRGARGGCVRSVLSHKGSSSHLPPYSSQPDPYPEPSRAQQARCLIPTKRLPARGVDLWKQRRGGAPTARPFDPVPGPVGRAAPDRQHRVCSLLLLLSLLSATQTPGAGGETEEEGGGREKGGWWTNEHNEETDTD